MSQPVTTSTTHSGSSWTILAESTTEKGEKISASLRGIDLPDGRILLSGRADTRGLLDAMARRMLEERP